MIKSILVGVSEYSDSRYNIPQIANDLYVMRKALTVGLNANSDDIVLCGENGTVYTSELKKAFDELLCSLNIDDTFLFYFSGHGGKKNNKTNLVFSDNCISLETIIKRIDGMSCKNKIVIIDCCHAGSKNSLLLPSIDIRKAIDEFVGHGCAVMASCGLDEVSGFDTKLPISLYTKIIYEAFTSRSLIKNGRKSLEDINEYIDRLVKIANEGAFVVQHNSYRSNIVGTVYFDVEKYEPFITQQIYKETDRYVICAVNPLHNLRVRRVSLDIILKFPCSENEVAEIANEIKDEAIHYEVYTSQNDKDRHSGLHNNIIFMCFGYDENDILTRNFVYRAIWVDTTQEKGNWYRVDKGKSIIDGVCIQTISSYDFSKKIIAENTADNETLVKMTRKCMIQMIRLAQLFIDAYRELDNRTVTEDEFITNTRDILFQIRKQVSILMLLH